MSKEEKRAILFGKNLGKSQVISGNSHWNNDSACLPVFFPVKEEEKKAA